ncbi:MAG: glycosyltransferase family 9 protein [Candidatus Baltobacteraceae bacterium]
MLGNLFQRHPAIAPGLPSTVLPAYNERHDRFARLRGERMAIYWPHGFGDWVHFGHVAPMLSPENTYAIFRLGDDYSALFAGARPVAALPSGIRLVSDGSALGAAHLGLNWRRLSGNRERIALPGELPQAFAAFAPTALLYTDYPEPEGRLAFPFHTKARALARSLIEASRLSKFDLARPLPQSLQFAVAPALQRRFDDALARYITPQDRLLLVATSGHTEPAKAWPSEDARAFVDLVRARDPRLRVVVLDALGDPNDGWLERSNAISFRTVAAEIDEPFAQLFLALLARLHAFVGVPAGPLHAVSARGGIPLVGLWFAHYPTWYDEPNPLALHLVGARPIARGFHLRPASTSLPETLAHRIEVVGTESISPERVLDALVRIGAI